MARVDEVRKEQLNVTLPAPLLDKLRLVAKRDGRTQSGIIEEAVKDFFRRQDGEPFTAEELAVIEAVVDQRLQSK